MRAFFKIVALVSEDVEQADKVLERVLPVDDADATASTFGAITKVLDPLEALYLVPMGGVTAASYVLVVADQEVEVRLNGSGSEPVPLRPKAAVAASELLSETQRAPRPGVMCLVGTDVTSIHLSNPTSDEARAFVMVIGEAE